MINSAGMLETLVRKDLFLLLYMNSQKINVRLLFLLGYCQIGRDYILCK